MQCRQLSFSQPITVVQSLASSTALFIHFVLHLMMSVRNRNKRNAAKNLKSFKKTREEPPHSPTRSITPTHNKPRSSSQRWKLLLKQKRIIFLTGMTLGAALILCGVFSILHWQHDVYNLDAFRSILRDVSMNEMITSPVSSSDILDKITRAFSMQQNDADAVLPGRKLHEDGYKGEHPVFIIPGVVSTNLESWSRGGCGENYFRKKIWGDYAMATSFLMDKECWLKNLMLDFDTGLISPLRPPFYSIFIVQLIFVC